MAIRVTAFDVAQRAGVTQPTVSRALNGSPKVSDETRAKVLQAAQELGYVINQNATRLRRGETMTLAVVLIGRAGESATETNPFYFSLLAALQLQLQPRVTICWFPFRTVLAISSANMTMPVRPTG